MRLQASLKNELTTTNSRTKIKQNIEFTTPLINFFRYFCKFSNTEGFAAQIFITRQLLFAIALDILKNKGYICKDVCTIHLAYPAKLT